MRSFKSRLWRGVAAGVLVGPLTMGCAKTSAPTTPPLVQEPGESETPAYSDEDAQEELGFGTAPTPRIRARRRSIQRKSTTLHGARRQPCTFDDCDISDEDDPLRRH